MKGVCVELELSLAAIPEKLDLQLGALALTGLCILWRKWVETKDKLEIGRKVLYRNFV